MIARRAIDARRAIALIARIAAVCLLSALAVSAYSTGAFARHRRHPRPKRTAVATPSPTPLPREFVTLIMGGAGNIERPTGASPGVLDTAEIYDPAERRFLPIAAMKERRNQFAAVAISADQVLVVGGINTLLVPLTVIPGPTMPWILSSAEIFDSTYGQFAPTSNMKLSRDKPTATMLPNGKVLIVGGDSKAAELYDPRANAFAETSDLAASRDGQTATLLRDGRVLIA